MQKNQAQTDFPAIFGWFESESDLSVSSIATG